MKTLFSILCSGFSILVFSQNTPFWKEKIYQGAPYQSEIDYCQKIKNNPIVTEKFLNDMFEKMTAHSRKINNVLYQPHSKEELLKVFMPLDTTNFNYKCYEQSLFIDIFSMEKKTAIIIDKKSEKLLDAVLVKNTSKKCQDFLNFHIKTDDEVFYKSDRDFIHRQKMYENKEFPYVSVVKNGKIFTLIDFITQKEKVLKISKVEKEELGSLIVTVE